MMQFWLLGFILIHGHIYCGVAQGPAKNGTPFCTRHGVNTGSQVLLNLSGI